MSSLKWHVTLAHATVHDRLQAMWLGCVCVFESSVQDKLQALFGCILLECNRICSNRLVTLKKVCLDLCISFARAVPEPSVGTERSPYEASQGLDS